MGNGDTMVKTVKFGGSSLADAGQFAKCAAIVRADTARRYVVVSAPGKRDKQDIKITDLFYRCQDAAVRRMDFSADFERIRARYEDIIAGLGLELSLDDAFMQIESDLKTGADSDYAASRGEYLSALVMACYLKRPMIDAADCIFFDDAGNFDAVRTQETLSLMLSHVPQAVFPGFYGSLPNGSIRTFSRGGSDITGAIVARAAAATLYENWTDVSGLLTCDPAVVPNPRPIANISYAELRELAYMGASVMHEATIFPVKAVGIPINIRNTNAPEEPGTMIQPNAACNAEHPVTGIAGRKHFSSILIEKDQMNETAGFGMRVLEVLYRYGLQMEHLPTGIDTMSVVVSTERLNAHRSEVLHDLRAAVAPDSLCVKDDLAIIAVVGHGMVHHAGLAARALHALAQAQININMIDQDSGEYNIILGIDARDFDVAMNALYREFFACVG